MEYFCENRSFRTGSDKIFPDGEYPDPSGRGASFINITSTDVGEFTANYSRSGNTTRLLDQYDPQLPETIHEVNSEILTGYSKTGMNGRLIYRDETAEYSKNRIPTSYGCSFPNSEEEHLKAGSLASSGSYHMTRKTSVLDQEYAASQTTEAILAEIFGKNTCHSGPSRPRYSYEDHASGYMKEIYNGAEVCADRKKSSFKVEPQSLVGNIRHKSTNSSGETTAKNFNTEKRNHEIGALIPPVNSFGNDALFDKFSTVKNESFKTPGTEVSNDLCDSHFGGGRITNEDSNTSIRSVNTAAVRTSKQITPSLSVSHRPSLVQSNVVDYYERLKNESKTWQEERILERMTPRKGVRSKSSEMPLRNDDHR